MRKFYIYFPIIAFAVILQTSSIPVLFEGFWLPDVVLMMVMAWSLIDGFEKFLPVAIATGVLYDLLAFQPVGMSAIVFVLAIYGVSFFSKRFSTDMRGMGLLLSLFFVFSATLGSRFIHSFDWMTGSYFLENFSNALMIARVFVWVFLWNCVYFILWFFVLNKIEKYFDLKRDNKIIIKA